MANNFESNFSRKLLEKVIAGVEAKRVLSKNVNTQMFQGMFDPSTGETIDVQRPTDHVVVRTSDGDITGQNSDIITGKASATAQDYITVRTQVKEADQALKMGKNQSRFWDDIANRVVIALETSFAQYMLRNTGLLAGDVGTGVTKWGEVANAGAIVSETGVPVGDLIYAFNSFTQVELADQQRSLGTQPEVRTANDKATVSEDFAGMTVKAATTLQTYRSGVGADRVGALDASPIVTYLAAKDTMTQQLALTGFESDLEIKAGEQISIAGRYRLNGATKDVVLDSTMSEVTWTATVTTDATLDVSGEGTIIVTGPAIYEAGGAYNTVDSALTSGDIVTILGAADTIVKPNLFWHRNAFTIAFIDIEKLHSTDTVAQTEDGLVMRVSRYADGDANRNIVRFDLRPAFGTMNPLFAGQGFGIAP